MQAIKCEICGSSDIIKKDGIFVCQYCGTQYTADEVRKLLGTVRIDKTEDIDNYLTLARRSLESSNFDKAAEYYELVLRNDPNNIEAIFNQPYCTAMGYPLSDLQQSASDFRISLNAVFNALSTHDQRDDCVDAIINGILNYCDNYSDAAANDLPRASRNAIDYYNAINNGLFELHQIYFGMEQVLKQQFTDRPDLLQLVQSKALYFYRSLGSYFMKAIPLMKEKNRLKSELK